MQGLRLDATVGPHNCVHASAQLSDSSRGGGGRVSAFHSASLHVSSSMIPSFWSSRWITTPRNRRDGVSGVGPHNSKRTRLQYGSGPVSASNSAPSLLMLWRCPRTNEWSLRNKSTARFEAMRAARRCSIQSAPVTTLTILAPGSDSGIRSSTYRTMPCASTPRRSIDPSKYLAGSARESAYHRLLQQTGMRE